MSTPKRGAATIAELAAARSDMTGAIARHIEYLFDAYSTSERPLSVQEASEQARTPLPAALREREPDQVNWNELGNLLEHDPIKGAALWESIKQAARLELQSGTRASKAIERSSVNSDPYERAQFLAILEALTASLKPQGGPKGCSCNRWPWRSSRCSAGRRSRPSGSIRNRGSVNAIGVA